MEHTPGPWKVDENGKGVIAPETKPGSIRTFGYGCSNNFICSLDDGEYHNYSNPKEMKANALLISFAPDLLEAFMNEHDSPITKRHLRNCYGCRLIARIRGEYCELHGQKFEQIEDRQEHFEHEKADSFGCPSCYVLQKEG